MGLKGGMWGGRNWWAGLCGSVAAKGMHRGAGLKGKTGRRRRCPFSTRRPREAVFPSLN